MPEPRPSGTPQPENRQGRPPRDGQVDVFAGPEPDGIPMTGEEDPLAEVDDGSFGETVAAFAKSEHEAMRQGERPARPRPVAKTEPGATRGMDRGLST